MLSVLCHDVFVSQPTGKKEENRSDDDAWECLNEVIEFQVHLFSSSLVRF